MIDWLPWLPRILGALFLVLVAAGVSRWQKVALEQDMLIAVARAFIQLVAIGYALELVFGLESFIGMSIIIGIMIAVAGYTAGNRGKNIPHSHRIATISVTVAALLTLSSLLLLKVFPLEVRTIIPIAGMIVGNSMTSTGLTMARLRDDLKANRHRIEAALALGAPSQQAARPQMRTALATGMTPIVDNTKTVGLIALPGAMTGMILAGASPLDAVLLQIVVMYMLIGAAAFSSLSATFLTYREFFSAAHQLRLPEQ